MTMDLGGETYLAQTCLIARSGDLFATEPLGIDLSALALDLSAELESTSPLAAEISALLGEKEDRHMEDDEKPLKLDGLDDFLDFEVSEDVWMAINQTDLFGTTSLMDSSPAATPLTTDTDYSNLVSMSSPPASMLTAGYSSTLATSPISMADDDSYASSPGSDSTEPRLKRTRGRAIDKKQSNKAAATKYRTKKVQEKETLFAECAEYERKNGELKRLIDDCQVEISFIKSLLVEALIAKNTAKA